MTRVEVKNSPASSRSPASLDKSLKDTKWLFTFSENSFDSNLIKVSAAVGSKSINS